MLSAVPDPKPQRSGCPCCNDYSSFWILVVLLSLLYNRCPIFHLLCPALPCPSVSFQNLVLVYASVANGSQVDKVGGSCYDRWCFCISASWLRARQIISLVLVTYLKGHGTEIPS